MTATQADYELQQLRGEVRELAEQVSDTTARWIADEARTIERTRDGFRFLITLGDTEREIDWSQVEGWDGPSTLADLLTAEIVSLRGRLAASRAGGCEFEGCDNDVTMCEDHLAGEAFDAVRPLEEQLDSLRPAPRLLREILSCTFSGDDVVLLAVGLGGTDERLDKIREQAKRMTAAHGKARDYLGSADPRFELPPDLRQVAECARDLIAAYDNTDGWRDELDLLDTALRNWCGCDRIHHGANCRLAPPKREAAHG